MDLTPAQAASEETSVAAWAEVAAIAKTEARRAVILPPRRAYVPLARSLREVANSVCDNIVIEDGVVRLRDPAAFEAALAACKLQQLTASTEGFGSIPGARARLSSRQQASRRLARLWAPFASMMSLSGVVLPDGVASRVINGSA